MVTEGLPRHAFPLISFGRRFPLDLLPAFFVRKSSLLSVTTFRTFRIDNSTSLKSKWKLAKLVVWSMNDRDLLRLGRDHDRP